MTKSSRVEDPELAHRERVISSLAAIAFVALVATAGFADYLSSWLPRIGGYPAGAILRDGVAAAFIVLAVLVLIWQPLGRQGATATASLPVVARFAIVPFALFATWVLVLVPISPALVPAILGARNLLLYVLVGFATYALVSRRALRSGVVLGVFTAFGFIAASLGILDTLTNGDLVVALGYRRDYSGVTGSENRLIAGASALFEGYVRASGGISNALVFGYLMAAIAVFGTWMLDRAVRQSGWRSIGGAVYLALAILATMACIESLTRGAIVALAVGQLTLVVVRRRRPIAVGALTAVGVALLLTWATQGGLSNNPSGGAVPIQAAQGSQTPASSQPDDSDILGTLGTRITSGDPSSQESSSLRLDQFRRGLESLRARPMGNGLGSEGSASTRAPTPGADLTPDVFVMIVALQTGIVGAVLYGLLLAATIFGAVRRSTEGRDLVLAMVGIFGIAAVLSSSPDAPVLATTIWILILAVSASTVFEGHREGVSPASTETDLIDEPGAGLATT
ncbi:MAG TPA: O-antigen ligase family protein [Armatimonadota bacterium]